jgi:hypothetical protein
VLLTNGRSRSSEHLDGLTGRDRPQGRRASFDILWPAGPSVNCLDRVPAPVQDGSRTAGDREARPPGPHPGAVPASGWRPDPRERSVEVALVVPMIPPELS